MDPVVTSEPQYVADFEAILDQLRRAGFTMSAIERETRIDRSSLLNYLTYGATPLHPNGEKLIDFYCQAMSIPRERVPKRRALPSVAHALR